MKDILVLEDVREPTPLLTGDVEGALDSLSAHFST